PYNGPGSTFEYVLSSITYTGTASPAGTACNQDNTQARSVRFNYTFDRPDMRTTYHYGVATPMTARLSSITTAVPALSVSVVPPRAVSDGTTVAVYNLSYVPSNATRRSLLHSVQLCATAACASDLSLPPTYFNYQND